MIIQHQKNIITHFEYVYNASTPEIAAFTMMSYCDMD